MASYTTFFRRLFSSRGQGVFLGQLHVLSSGGGFGQKFGISTGNNFLHVLGTAVAYFDSVPIQ